MARKHDRERKPPAEPAGNPSGALADAIAAHLELKKEHGVDPDTVEQERRSALAPTRRDMDAAADSLSEPPPVAPEQAQPTAVPAVPVESALPAEPAPQAPEYEAFEPAPSPGPPPADEPSPPEPPPPEPVLPTEDTGNFEFDWDGEVEEPPVDESAESTEQQPAAPDVLEQTPEFFEETPEYDRLWFEERPPRDFNF